ncbi:RNA polymerase sigma factor [Flavivirga rizhaonensis]|uniref:RNA polymerase sigma-70 factor n=1 Tax=Flavivirga rizhaonensis TaxID=2559571 RepID=A0A4V3P4K8_9FLAO|nr:RNA polymerase sigma-70 factor [Flavivirga rizhaonensis]TGV01814.1 RNA polymerase sigma-70 factor [Flavivirga rizhaonensis]
MDDLVLVSKLKQGDKKAFKLLFECYYDRLVAYIITFCHDKMQAEDVVQLAFINLWEDREKLDEKKSPRSYLYAIAYNRYIDSIKKIKRKEKLLDIVWERALRSRISEDNEFLERRIEKMKQTIDLLPPKCKKIIQLNKIEGKKYSEIADSMGISIKTVESQMRIAFNKIREALKKDKMILFLMLKSIPLTSNKSQVSKLNL